MGNNSAVFYPQFLDFMVKSGALLFGDFTLKSGRKSPYFINTGEYKTGEQLSLLGKFYARLIENSVCDEPHGLDYKFTDAERKEVNAKLETKFNVLFGPAYKGIPLVTTTSAELSRQKLNFKISFDRKERKDHGEVGDILGYVPQNGDKIAIVEDVTTAGTSIRETSKLLEQLGVDAKVVALYISVDRMERGTGEKSAIEQLKDELGIEVYSIATTEQIVEYLINLPADCTPIPNSAQHAENIRKYLAEYGARKY